MLDKPEAMPLTYKPWSLFNFSCSCVLSACWTVRIPKRSLTAPSDLSQILAAPQYSQTVHLPLQAVPQLVQMGIPQHQKIRYPGSPSCLSSSASGKPISGKTACPSIMPASSHSVRFGSNCTAGTLAEGFCSRSRSISTNASSA